MSSLRLCVVAVVVVVFAACPPASPPPPDACVAAAETCNHVDDDCDGVVDDGFELGGACTRGVGACAAVGVMVCGADGGTVCDAEVKPGAPETCNALDDDCDGETDEGVADCCVPGTSLPCGVNVGACGTGTQLCLPQRSYDVCRSVTGAPVRHPGEVAESCNELDDDCDGATDEDLPGCCATGAVRACGASEGVCRAGTQTCTGAHVFGPCVDGDGQQVLLPGDVTEACNGLDDDCDGQTDESYAVGEACDGAGSDACADGVAVCTANGQSTECVETAPNKVERCNGLDDDCDGQTDESFLEQGEPCALPGPACLVGEWSCAAGGVPTCVAGPGGARECCGNGIDDDGDGQTDEDTFEERCNGIDDDCDGLTDEDGLLPCAQTHAVTSSACIDNACAVVTCAPGFFDRNHLFFDGCESPIP